MRSYSFATQRFTGRDSVLHGLLQEMIHAIAREPRPPDTGKHQ
jgi:hypothetical protein